MKLTDTQIIQIHNFVSNAGHPDPIGFVARMDVKSGFDPDSTFKNGIGLSGVNSKKMDQLGIIDKTDIFENTNAAVIIDLENFDGNIEEMFRKSNPERKASTNTFLRKLRKSRDVWEKKLIVEGGLAKGFQSTQPKPPKAPTGSKENFKVIQRSEAVPMPSKKDLAMNAATTLDAGAADALVESVLAEIVSIA